LAAITSGPQAWGKLLVDTGKQVISTLNQWGQSAIESMSIQENLSAIIKSSGASAWTTTSQLNKLASEQSAATGKAKDEITQMQTVLLGFNNVTKDVFKDATQSAIAMSAVMGGGLAGAANTLGKALDVPSQGLTALSRQGFRFTEQQKAMVVEFEKQGKLVEAQRVILDSVQSAYGEAGTSTNAVVKAQTSYNNAMAEFKQQIGMGWMEAISGLKQGMADIVQAIVDTNNKLRELEDARKEVATGSAEDMERLIELEKELDRARASRRKGSNIKTRPVAEIEAEIQAIKERTAELNKYTEANLFL
jgi:hypothetical protein